MSENLPSERTATSRPTRESAVDPASRFVPIADGRVARFDPPQQVASPPGSSEAAGIVSLPAAPRHDEELLTQASQLVDHLRNQFSELHRRDQTLAAQNQQIEEERRSLRLWKQEAEQELHLWH